MTKEDDHSTERSGFSTLENTFYEQNLATFGGFRGSPKARTPIQRISSTDGRMISVHCRGSSFSNVLHSSYNEAVAKKRLGNDLLPSTYDMQELQTLLKETGRNKSLDRSKAFGKYLARSVENANFEHTTWTPIEPGMFIKDQLTYPVFLRRGIIDHRSHFFYCWNISSVLTSILNAIVIPLWVGFYFIGDSHVFKNMDGYEGFFFTFILCTTIQNFTDVFIRSNLTFYSPGGRIVSKRKAIMQRYLKSWFIIDAIAGFPYQIFLINDGPPTYGYCELLRLVKFLRILTTDVGFTSTVICGFLMQHGLNVSLRTLALVRALLLLIIVIHIIACGAYVVAHVIGLDVPWQSPLTNGPDTRSEEYSEAFYWATMTATTTGYGDIEIDTTEMQVYATFAMLTGALMWSTIIAVMANLLRESSIDRNLQERKVYGLSKFVSMIRGDKQTRSSLLIHMKRVTEYPSMTLSSIHMLLNDLSPSMRASLLLRMHAFWLNKHPYFLAVNDPWYIWSLSHALQSVRFHPDEYLAVEGCRARRLIIIHIGCCIAERKGCLMANCTVGEEMFLSNPTAYVDSFRVLIMVEAWVLDELHLKELTNRYPELKKMVKKAAVRLAFRRNVSKVLYDLQVKKLGRASLSLPVTDVSVLHAAENGIS